MSYRKTYVSDEYRYETVNETTIKYVPPPVLAPPPRPTVTLYRSPSLTSLVSFSSRVNRPKSFRLPRNTENIVNIKVETDYKRPIENRIDTTLVTYNTNTENKKTEEYDYKYKYTLNESYETTRRNLSIPQSKSYTQITKIEPAAIEITKFEPAIEIKTETKPETRSSTYVFNSDDNDRQVTFIKHTENDSGLSLPGCLVKASPTFLPVTRSLQLGAIFNGNSFGLLTEHLAIKDNFNVSFDFKTTIKNGVLMIIVDSVTNDSFFIELYDSQLKATLLIDGEPDSCWTDFPTRLLTNDVWINVNVQVIGTRMTMTVKNDFFTKHHRHQLLYPIRGDLFVAGYPSTISPPFACRSKDFFIGEMRNFYVNNEGIKWYGTPSNLSLRLRNWY